MMDLFSRAGLLEEAQKLIKTMPMEQDKVIWRALLSGCRVYKESELHEVACGKMSILNSGDYVLL